MIYTVDWGATGDMLSGLGTWVGAGVVGYAAWIGREAISKIRVRKKVEREFEAGEQVLAAAYKAKSAIEGVRAHFIRSSEENNSEKSLRDANADFDNLSQREKKAYVSRSIIYKRMEFFKEDFDAIFSIISAAKIYFGSKAEEALLEIARARQKILVAADMLPTLAEMKDEGSSDREFTLSVRRDLYGSSDPNEMDSVTKSLNGAITVLETQLLPKLLAATDD